MQCATRDALTLAPSRLAPAQARRAVHDFACAVSPACADTAELLASELVTNAVTHGRGQVRVLMEYDAAGLAITVCDDEPSLPVISDAPVAATGGRGMRLVDVLSTSWGVTRERPGKAVWFRLDGR